MNIQVFEGDVEVSSNPIDDLVCKQPMVIPVNGVDAANQRIGLPDALVRSCNSRAQATELIDGIFSQNNICVADNKLGSSPIQKVETEEKFTDQLSNELDRSVVEQRYMTGALNQENMFQMKPTGVIRVLDASEWKLSNGSPYSNDKDVNDELNEFVNDVDNDALGSGKLNDAIIRNYISNNERGETSRVVNNLLNDYALHNPSKTTPVVKPELPCSKVQNNSDDSTDDDEPDVKPNVKSQDSNGSFTVVLILVIILLFLGIYCLTVTPSQPKVNGGAGLTNIGW